MIFLSFPHKMRKEYLQIDHDSFLSQVLIHRYGITAHEVSDSSVTTKTQYSKAVLGSFICPVVFCQCLGLSCWVRPKTESLLIFCHPSSSSDFGSASLFLQVRRWPSCVTLFRRINICRHELTRIVQVSHATLMSFPIHSCPNPSDRMSPLYPSSSHGYVDITTQLRAVRSLMFPTACMWFSLKPLGVFPSAIK